MARQLFTMRPLTKTSQAGLATVTLLLCAFALFICASHSRKWRRLSARYGFRNRDPVIQLNTDAMFLTNGADDQDAPVWQKNILMGGKCELPDYSGVIIYDSAGNIISNGKNSRAITVKNIGSISKPVSN